MPLRPLNSLTLLTLTLCACGRISDPPPPENSPEAALIRLRWALDHPSLDARHYADFRLVAQAQLLAAQRSATSDSGTVDPAQNSIAHWETQLAAVDQHFDAANTRGILQTISRTLGNGTCHRRSPLPLPEAFRSARQPISGAPLIANGLRAVVTRRASGATAGLYQCDTGGWLEAVFAPRDPPDGNYIVVAVNERPAP